MDVKDEQQVFAVKFKPVACDFWCTSESFYKYLKTIRFYFNFHGCMVGAECVG